MHFLYPVFLSALAVLVIPVVIHLFYFKRYKTIRFPDLRFLKNVLTERKNRNTLKHLLVLLSRCAAFACLVLAFALPGCEEVKSKSSKTRIAIFIDNSISMSQSGDKGILFETAKAKAREIVKSYGDAAEFSILEHHLKAGDLEFLNVEEAVKTIDGLQISSASVPFKKIWNHLESEAKLMHLKCFFISDFQSSFLSQIPAKDSTLDMECVGLKIQYSKINNLAIDTAWLANPFAIAGEKNTLFYKVSNFGTEDISALNVRLSSNGTTSGLGQISLPANNAAVGSIEFIMPPENRSEAVLTIEDENYPFDNALNLTIGSRNSINVLFQSEHKFVLSAIQRNAFFKISGTPSNANDKSNYGAWYVDVNNGITDNDISEFKKYTSAGGQLILAPKANADVVALKKLSAAFGLPEFKTKSGVGLKLAKDGLSNPFFSQVFSTLPKNIEMPTVKNYFSSAGLAGLGESVLTLENGDPFLLKFKLNRGGIYLFTAPLNESAGNFYQSVLFLPTVTNCAINETKTAALFGFAASGNGLILKNPFKVGDGNLKLTYKNVEMVPEVQYGPEGLELFIGPNLNEAGFYTLTDKKDVSQMEWIALNNSRTESDPTPASDASLQKLQINTGMTWLSPNLAAAVSTSSDAAKGLWWMFIWFAAGFFVLELLLLVFWDRVAIFVNRFRQSKLA